MQTEQNLNCNNWEDILTTKWAGRNFCFREEVVSTNVTAGELGNSGAAHGTLVAADKQTGGRGRRGRTWESPAGKNLYFSLLLRPEFGLEKVSMLTLVMAHSVARAIEATVMQSGGAICPANKSAEHNMADVGKVGNIRTGIKWPNDILVHGKKVCGILTELKADKGKVQHVVIGVGINVKPQIFEGELADKASSLEQECHAEISRSLLLKNIMEYFEEDYETFAAAGSLQPFLEEYHSRLLNKGAQVRVLDPKEPFEGIAEGITETGELIVERLDGSLMHVYAGEVSIRGLQGYV